MLSGSTKQQGQGLDTVWTTTLINNHRATVMLLEAEAGQGHDVLHPDIPLRHATQQHLQATLVLHSGSHAVPGITCMLLFRAVVRLFFRGFMLSALGVLVRSPKAGLAYSPFLALLPTGVTILSPAFSSKTYKPLEKLALLGGNGL